VDGTGGASLTDRDAGEIERRKGEHLDLAVGPGVEPASGAGWDDVRIVHDALPVVDQSGVDLSVDLLGRRLALPLVIAGMTGGHARAREVNARLAGAAQRWGVALGIGSQRAALRDPSLIPTYAVARETAPRAFIIGNIGIGQLVDQEGGPAFSTADVQRAIDMIRADALAVHLNYLEESIQPEGQTRARGAADALGRLARTCPVPVIAKETGSGISRATAMRLAALGVAAIDVGGFGGTSFAAIEAKRATAQRNAARAQLGERFSDWGIPTAVSVVAACAAGVPIIATGGVRSGRDAAAAFALGATAVGVGRPLLQAAMQGAAAIDEWIGQFELELRTAVFLSGASSVRDLGSAPRVILGQTRLWLDQLGGL
jgi:isopentenyl-diphosphate delta-isomerase